MVSIDCIPVRFIEQINDMWFQKKKKQATCCQWLIYANYCPKYNLAGKSNTTFKKFITFSHDVNREIKHRQRNGRLQRFATETDKAKGFVFGGKSEV